MQRIVGYMTCDVFQDIESRGRNSLMGNAQDLEALDKVR